MSEPKDWFDVCVTCTDAWCCGRCRCCPPAQHRNRVRLLRVGALLARKRQGDTK